VPGSSARFWIFEMSELDRAPRQRTSVTGIVRVAVECGRVGRRSCRCTTSGLLITALLAVSAGCGGAIRNDELRRGIETLRATAAEGRLVAVDVVEDRTKVTFVRVEARDLGQDAEHEAEKLSDAQAKPGNARVNAQAVQLAQQIGAALGDLEVSPTDRGLARRVELRLGALSKRADRLAAQL
jgi:hypothetical protein